MIGPYKWTGKGYGINLADDDGYQIDGSLRSPHNGHMTILARSGLPGITLWAAVQLTWAGAMTAGYMRARRRHDWKWSALFMFLPSGLVLYYVTNTALGVLQQWNINRRITVASARKT